MEKNILNVLLLGETGVGKSTFINAFLNYLTHENLRQASRGKLRYFVPTNFSILDDDFQERTVRVGHSPDENQMVAASATQNPGTYLLDLGTYTLRLIDTPGIGDTRGMKYDKINTEKVMRCISHLKYLNAICVLLKPDLTKLSPQFEYCFKQMLASLDRRVQNNITFVFTHARCDVGDAMSLLKQLLGRIPNVTIRPNEENTFHTENDPFRYLAAVSCGLRIDGEQVKVYEKSWNSSSETCERLVDYISKLNPVPMQDTVTINEARRVVANLAQPIAEMLVLYDKAVDRLKRHELVLKESKNTVAKLKENLYIPVIEFQVKQIIRNTTETRNQGWNAGLSFFPRPPYAAFNVGYEQSETVQTHTQEILEPIEVQIEDASIKAQLEHSQNATEVAALKISEINSLIDEYGKEAETILSAAAEFSTFLEENAIVPYGDLFLMYFQYLSEREREKGSDADEKTLRNLDDLLVRYKEKKISLSGVSAADIITTIERLKRLEHCGVQFGHFHGRVFELKDNRYNTADRVN